MKCKSPYVSGRPHTAVRSSLAPKDLVSAEPGQTPTDPASFSAIKLCKTQ